MQMKWERNANPKRFTSQTGLCLHGTVLYVCMYLISLYEDYVFFLFSIILLQCSDLCLLLDAYSVTPCAAKEQNASYLFQNKSQRIFHV